jgi:hypothetical protein
VPHCGGVSTDSPVVHGIGLFDRARYEIVRFAHEDANIGCRRFSLVRFRCFLRLILGLINRLNPYVVRESYLVRGSYGGNGCKGRSRKVINKTCAYSYVGLTPRLPSLCCTIVFVLSRSYSNASTVLSTRTTPAVCDCGFGYILYTVQSRCLERYYR